MAPAKGAPRTSAQSRRTANPPGASQEWIEAPAPTWAPAPPPPAPMDERQYGLLLHLSALAGLIIGFFFVGPLVMWLIKKDQSAFIDRHGRAAMDFQLSMLIYMVAGALLIGLITIATLGFGLLLLIPVIILAAIAAGLVLIIFPIIAGTKANQGLEYDYPLSIRMLRRRP
ncbi:MAG: DUF4870 domain-containing protein, partial [Candidatus Thermoplasmatota archaeon]